MTDGSPGQTHTIQIFVALLGASNYTSIETTCSQRLQDWIASHMPALESFRGCAELCVSDNPRRGLSKNSRYQPNISPTYRDLAKQYGVGVLTAHSCRAKYNTKVENGGLMGTHWVLARPRHQRFFSFNELNRSRRMLLENLS